MKNLDRPLVLLYDHIFLSQIASTSFPLLVVSITCNLKQSFFVEIYSFLIFLFLDFCFNYVPLRYRSLYYRVRVSYTDGPFNLFVILNLVCKTIASMKGALRPSAFGGSQIVMDDYLSISFLFFSHRLIRFLLKVGCK